MSEPFYAAPLAALQQVAHQKAVDDMVRKHNLAVESLTEKQLAEAIRQALACGDLVRCVRIADNAQIVVYEPYTEWGRLNNRIQRLEQLLEEHGIEEEL